MQSSAAGFKQPRIYVILRSNNDRNAHLQAQGRRPPRLRGCETMYMSKNALSVALILVLLLTPLAGCGGSKVVGKWTEASGKGVKGDFSNSIAFFSDGTFQAENVGGRCTLEKNTLKLKFDLFGASCSYEYKVSGDTLTLKADGRSIQYKKVRQ